jgi:hypothetical protein
MTVAYFLVIPFFIRVLAFTTKVPKYDKNEKASKGGSGLSLQ